MSEASKVPGETIHHLRELETFVLERLTSSAAEDFADEERREADRERFLALACDLELSVRALARELYRVRADARGDSERQAKTISDLAYANASLSLVVATAIGWQQGRASDAELREVVASLLDDRHVDDVTRRLAHSEAFQAGADDVATPTDDEGA